MSDNERGEDRGYQVIRVSGRNCGLVGWFKGLGAARSKTGNNKFIVRKIKETQNEKVGDVVCDAGGIGRMFAIVWIRSRL
jgi:hypothetical protein